MAALVAMTALVGCAGASAGAAPTRAVWRGAGHARGVVDLAGPRAGGPLVVAAAGRLLTRAPSGTLHPFSPAYTAPRGLEPYIALSPGQRVAGAGCRFAGGALYALRLTHGDGVTEVTPSGRVRRFAALPRRGLENGIAFDTTGRFGHRLLVTATTSGRTTVFAIDCRGRARVLTRYAPRLEGGLAVAPAGFGRFGGELIAPDELSGAIYAIAPDGSVRLVARSGIPHGQDVGVESEGFVPSRFSAAYVADRLTRGNRHPGDDLVLALTASALRIAGVHAGDLLVVSEGGADTVAVRCRRGCQVRRVASGPPEAHVEGHVVFGQQ